MHNAAVGCTEDLMKRTWVHLVAAIALLVAGYSAVRMSAPASLQAQQAGMRVFEWRTYTAPDAEKFAMLNARFREHTTRLFEKHGMTNIGYWTPVETPNTLTYIIAHANMEAAKKSWAGFRADPDWQKIVADSKAKGLTGVTVESKYLQPTDYSPMK
jgi:predicted GIY-YIG superfamily endonuclease